MDNTYTFGILNYSVLFGYLVVMFGVGLWFAGKQKTTEDYFLAGRNMPWFIVATSMFATANSAVTYMGVPGTTYSENISLIVMAFMSLAVAPFLILLFYPFYSKLRVVTSYEYIAVRYGRNARFATSGLFIVARLGWLGVVIYAPALALSVVTGINLWLAIVLMGVLATVYTVIGGLAAVLWTDFLQFIFLVAGAIWVAVSLMNNVPDGFSGIINVAKQTAHLHVLEWRLNLFEMSGIIVAVSFFLQTMQIYGTDQATVQRLMSIKTFGGMAKAVVLNGFFELFIISLLIFLGLGMFAYFHYFPERLAQQITGDQVLPFYIMHALPAGISGVLITAIFAAAMSSMDSGINSLATVILNDFVKPLSSKPRTDRENIRLARILTFALGAFAVGIACFTSRIGHVFKASTAILALFAGPNLAIFLLGVLTRRANFKGWLVGTTIAIPATIWLQYRIEAHFIYYFPFCFGISFIIGYLASVLLGRTKAPAESTIWGRSKLKTSL